MLFLRKQLIPICETKRNAQLNQVILSSNQCNSLAQSRSLSSDKMESFRASSESGHRTRFTSHAIAANSSPNGPDGKYHMSLVIVSLCLCGGVNNIHLYFNSLRFQHTISYNRYYFSIILFLKASLSFS